MRLMHIGPLARRAVVILVLVGSAPASAFAAVEQPSDSARRASTEPSQDSAAWASTSAQHAAVTTGLLEMAAKYEADAEAHVAMAARYRRDPHPRTDREDPAVACQRMAQRARDKAARARARAAEHQRLADTSK